MGNDRRINAITVPVRADVSNFSKGMKACKKDAEIFGSSTARSFSVMGSGISDSLDKINKKLKFLSVTNVGILSSGMVGLAKAAKDAAESLATVGFKRITELGKDAAALGTSAEALSRLRAVARGAGDDVKDLGTFLGGLTERINDSIGKTTDASQAFAALGTSAEALQKMSPEDQVKALNKGFAALPDDAERARVAMLGFGQDGMRVYRTLTQGAAKFKNDFDSAPVISDEDVSEARKLEIALNKISDTVMHLADTFTTKLLPTITTAVDLLSAVAAKFGIVATVSKPIAARTPAAPQAPKPPGQAIAAQKDLAEKQLDAADAQARLAKMQAERDSLAGKIRNNPPRVPSTNGGTSRVNPRDRTARERLADMDDKLAQTRRQSEILANAAKTPAQAAAEAVRMNSKLMTQVNDLKQEYRQTIESSGKDEIHRRVDTLKGISPDDKKALIRQGYQAREAGKTSTLRDELQESTKLPFERLSEDIARINRLVKLGPENGGLSRIQGIRAAAQKTAESGLGGQTQFAGAVQANSMEGRSYLLSQMNNFMHDPVAIAREGIAMTGQGNDILRDIRSDLRRNRETVASF